MKYLSVCSGIEAATVAWRPLGWRAVGFSEIEPFPSAVLAHHYPKTPNLGDMTLLPDMVLRGEIEAPDVLVGGTPCQSFSVAGLREGLSDERGQLTIKYVELANAIDTIRRRYGKDESIIIWENVPGVLSSKDNAFGCFIAALAGGDSEARRPGGGRWANAGYVLGPQRAVAWRALDAQYFGLPQRRKRVFLVASARDGFDPAKVLFELDGVRRDSAPSRETREETARTTTGGARAAGFSQGSHGQLVGTLYARDYKGAGNQFVSEGNLVVEQTYQDVSHCLNAGGMGRQDYETESFIIRGQSVRRLTPVECERLQGFPDGWTMIPWNGKQASECPDGHRYKALGNSMAVPVMRWIGERIDKFR